MDFRDLAAKEASDLAVRLTKAAQTAADLAAKKVSDDAQKAAETPARRAAGHRQAEDVARRIGQGNAGAARGGPWRAEDGDRPRRGCQPAARRGAQDQRETRSHSRRADAGAGRADAGTEPRPKANCARAARRSTAVRARTGAARSRRSRRRVAERAALEEAVSIAHSQSEAAEAKLAAVTDLFKQSAARVKVLEREQQDDQRAPCRDLESRKAPAAPRRGRHAAPDPRRPARRLPGARQSAATMSDVLTTLVEQLAAQFPRVALFRVKKSHLQGEHQIGFDLKTDIAKVVIAARHGLAAGPRGELGADRAPGRRRTERRHPRAVQRLAPLRARGADRRRRRHARRSSTRTTPAGPRIGAAPTRPSPAPASPRPCSSTPSRC